MDNLFLLNKLYSDYSAGLLEKKQLEEEIFKVICAQNHYLPDFGAENQDDFVSWLYPRINRAIGNYRETGSTFEAYVGSIIHLAKKEYRTRQVRNYVSESAAWTTQIPEIYTAEHEPDYGEQKAKFPEKIANPRQVLILILKCCSYVSPDFLERISPCLGLEPAALEKMINYLKKKMGKRLRIIAAMREKANYQLYRCIFYENALRAMTEDSITARRYRERLKRSHERRAKLIGQLAKLHPEPSNLQIAELLGISKGTVDSTLFNLRLKFKNKNFGICLN